MPKIILICGKICSGKTFYSQGLAKEQNAVILSCDEVSADLFHHSEGERFDEIAADIKKYLHKIAARIAEAGSSVILDWGFWTHRERREVSEYYSSLKFPFEWHYINISDEQWHQNISLRNQAVTAGKTTDFYVDDGLRNKIQRNFEPPERDEIDVWHEFKRL